MFMTSNASSCSPLSSALLLPSSTIMGSEMGLSHSFGPTAIKLSAKWPTAIILVLSKPNRNTCRVVPYRYPVPQCGTGIAPSETIFYESEIILYGSGSNFSRLCVVDPKLFVFDPGRTLKIIKKLTVCRVFTARGCHVTIFLQNLSRYAAIQHAF
jgi:hypothetical protein